MCVKAHVALYSLQQALSHTFSQGSCVDSWSTITRNTKIKSCPWAWRMPAPSWCTLRRAGAAHVWGQGGRLPGSLLPGWLCPRSSPQLGTDPQLPPGFPARHGSGPSGPSLSWIAILGQELPKSWEPEPTSAPCWAGLYKGMVRLC